MAKTKKQSRTLADILDDQDTFEIPFGVSRFFGSKVFLIAGQQACLAPNADADYGSKEELRGAVEWFVLQLGGKVTWE